MPIEPTLVLQVQFCQCNRLGEVQNEEMWNQTANQLDIGCLVQVSLENRDGFFRFAKHRYPFNFSMGFSWTDLTEDLISQIVRIKESDPESYLVKDTDIIWLFDFIN